MADTIIQVEKLSYQYPNSSGWALRDITFKVAKGEFLGIVGPTGAGKTTLAMCLRGLIPHNLGGTIGGDVRVDGHDIHQSVPGELASTIGIVFQNAETQAIGLTVLEDLAFGLENLNLPVEEMWKRINRVAEIVQIGDLLNRETWALSGGQKQRLAIGGVLVMEPKVLILDEPTAELDPCGKATIFDIVRRLQREQELTIIMIEHEVEPLSEVADQILVMNEGCVVDYGLPRRVFRNTALFHQIQEKVPFVADLLSDLIQKGVIPEDEFTLREDSTIALLQKYL